MRVESWQVGVFYRYLRVMLRLQRYRFTPSGGDAMVQQLLERRLEQREVKSLETILRVRTGFEQSRRVMEVLDFGAGGKDKEGSGKPIRTRTLKSIHRSSAVPHWWGIFLFRLVRLLNPSTVLELGSNLGISAAYIQAALDTNGSGGRLTSIEGDPSLASIAAETIAAVSPSAGGIVCGKFRDVLPSVLPCGRSLDLVFIDGHHAFEPTLEYFSRIEPSLSERAVVVFDDIYLWSRPVRRAWKEILRRYPAMIPLDLAKFGLLFVPSQPHVTGD